MNRYAIVTPTRDEEAFVRLTMKSLVAQTIRPSHWVIVDDGSMDQTAEIVAEYMREHPWIL